ncbi:chemotaxis protein CheA, partial [Billgrantia desiderata SP1]|uniref:Hpt domain-containing protein n=1 Tax=Billgrantia desiderata TaxID=52021 RepID=UPI000B6E76B1
MDITDFYDTFFEEAEELLADMERYLLELDVDEPDSEQLNAIFRAAHSIKGGAGTFGFDALQKTTHLFENLLDHTRKGELRLRRDIVDTFLETKDMLSDQLDAYRNGDEPDQEAFERICQTLQRLALEEIGQDLESGAPVASTPQPVAKSEPEPEALVEQGAASGSDLRVVALLNVGEKDRRLLVEELGQLGEVIAQEGDEACYEVTLSSSVSNDDIEAVMCFIIDTDQIEIRGADTGGAPQAEAPVAVPEVEKQQAAPAAVEPPPLASSAGPQRP